jgi:hypothetical protein
METARAGRRAEKIEQQRQEDRRRQTLEAARKAQAAEKRDADREQVRAAQRDEALAGERAERRRPPLRPHKAREPAPRPPSRDAKAESKKPAAPTYEDFLQLGVEGPASAAEAPPTILLPRGLFDGMVLQLQAALDDGREHGAVFGTSGGPRRYFTMSFVDGEVHQIDYSRARQEWPALKQIGTFHTHLWERIDTGLGTLAWAGGGHSDQDVFNLVVGERRMSAVVAQTRQGGRRIFFLVRPQTFTLVGGPSRFVAEYRRRVLALVEAGVDPVDASERELVRLTQSGVVVLYLGDGRVLDLATR